MVDFGTMISDNGFRKNKRTKEAFHDGIPPNSMEITVFSSVFLYSHTAADRIFQREEQRV
jgi:hypothetical protein